jgi:hypothetical protein
MLLCDKTKAMFAVQVVVSMVIEQQARSEQRSVKGSSCLEDHHLSARALLTSAKRTCKEGTCHFY